METTPQLGCTLITGASSGLGAEFALQLAPDVQRMVLVARRHDLLTELGQSLHQQYPHLQILIVPTDLTQPEAIPALMQQIHNQNWVVDRLINNAGMGDYGEFSTSEWPRIQAMLRLNIETLTELTHAVLPAMIAHGGGDILNVSSLASTLPIPDFAVYAASKAYVTSFSEALRIELLPHNIHVLALCPGPVHTGFGKVAQRQASSERKIPSRECFYVPKQQVVAEALLALQHNHARCYPSLKISLAALLITTLPIIAIRYAMSFRPRKNQA